MSFLNLPLKNQQVRLEPIQQAHLGGLQLAIEDGKLWELVVTSVPKPTQLPAFFSQTQSDLSSGLAQTYIIINSSNNRIVGSTRFMNTDWAHKRTEIGFTFIGRSHQRTSINTNAKYLMLTHAFEDLRFNRVAFVTDYLNQASRNAIMRLGAKQEGVLRNHMVMVDGRVRDSVSFSITANEWPGIKLNLEEKLNR